MSQQIYAVYTGGVIRPLEPVSLTEGETLNILLLPEQKQSKVSPIEILSSIAGLSIEGKDDGFSGEDHDQVLYPLVGQNP